MKKITAMILVALFVLAFPISSFADIDLSGLSFDQLVQLKSQIDLAIWNSQEWQEVVVPQGCWSVGSDIPAGKWTIYAEEGGHTYVSIGQSVSSSGTEIERAIDRETVCSESYKYIDDSDVVEWTIEIHDGEFIEIEYGSAVFTPFAGKQSLGFNF